MSSYSDNWKAFVDETKEMSDEQLQEYVGDIMRAIGGLSSQSGQGGKKSHLSGLGSAANVAASDKRKKDAAAKKAAQLRAMPTIDIFKGKQGKGIQSQLARAGIEEKTANKILKALQKDFAEAGYNVMENAARKVIALKNTLQAIGDLTDLVEKEKVKKIIVNMLRQNKIKLDPQSSKALRSVTVYTIPDKWFSSDDANEIFNSLQGYKKLGEEQFKKDILALAQVLGPFKSDKLYKENTLNAKIQKFANNNYTQRNKQELIKALTSLPSDHGAIRILNHLKNEKVKLAQIAAVIFKQIQRTEN